MDIVFLEGNKELELEDEIRLSINENNNNITILMRKIEAIVFLETIGKKAKENQFLNTYKNIAITFNFDEYQKFKKIVEKNFKN